MDRVKRGSRRNFFQVDNGIFDKRLNLEALDKLIYICLLRYADNTSQEAFPAQNTIANDIGIKRNRVNQGIKALEKIGLIEKKQRYDRKGSQKSNLYIVFDANEVMHRVYPENTGGVSQEYRGCISGIHGGVSQGYTKKTHLKILNEKEGLQCEELLKPGELKEKISKLKANLKSQKIEN